MVDQSGKRPISAEALYAKYQHNRPVMEEVLQSTLDSNVSDTTAIEDESMLAEKLYKHYQAIRKTDAQEHVDSAMRKFNDQGVAGMLQSVEQSSVLQDVTIIESINAGPGTIEGLSRNKAPAANSPGILKRWLLPGVAAAILGVVIIPMLMVTPVEHDSLQATVPTALIDQAVQTVAFIEPQGSGSLGFSGFSNAAKNAFHNGIIATDLQLLIEAEKGTTAQMFLLALAAAQGANQQDTTPLSSLFQTTTVNLNDALATGESMRVLRNYLAEMNYVLEDMADNAGQLNWYLAGRSVESIRIAAEYALENSDTEPLEQALLLGSQIDQPDAKASASGMLAQLLESNVSGSKAYLQASEVLEKARNVIFLMK